MNRLAAATIISLIYGVLPHLAAAEEPPKTLRVTGEVTSFSTSVMSVHDDLNHVTCWVVSDSSSSRNGVGVALQCMRDQDLANARSSAAREQAKK